MDEDKIKELEERQKNRCAERNYNFFRPVGQIIEHVDTINFSMDKDGTFHFENVGQVNGVPRDVLPQTTVETSEADERGGDEEGDEGKEEAPGGVDEGKEEELVAQLKPIFYNNEEDVRLFLKMIRGMAQEDITELVNGWVVEKRISNYGNSRKGKLWEILHDAGLYTKTRANWNGRVH